MPSFCYAAGAEIHTYIASSHCARVCVCVCISIYACVCVSLSVCQNGRRISEGLTRYIVSLRMLCVHCTKSKVGVLQLYCSVLQLCCSWFAVCCSVLQCGGFYLLVAQNWKVWEPVATAVMHTYCRFIVPVDRMLTWNHNGQACSMFTIGGESQSKRQSDLVYVIACLSFDWWLLLLPVTVIWYPCLRVYVAQIHVDLSLGFRV